MKVRNIGVWNKFSAFGDICQKVKPVDCTIPFTFHI